MQYALLRAVPEIILRGWGSTATVFLSARWYCHGAKCVRRLEGVMNEAVLGGTRFLGRGSQSLPTSYRRSGERCRPKLPQRGPGRSPAVKWFYHILNTQDALF